MRSLPVRFFRWSFCMTRNKSEQRRTHSSIKQTKVVKFPQGRGERIFCVSINFAFTTYARCLIFLETFIFSHTHLLKSAFCLRVTISKSNEKQRLSIIENMKTVIYNRGFTHPIPTILKTTVHVRVI